MLCLKFKKEREVTGGADGDGWVDDGWLDDG